jgi:GxxExxY protein
MPAGGVQHEFDPLSQRVIGCAMEVHTELGPGLLESAYEQCLAHELRTAGIPFELQKPVPVRYRDVRIDCGYRLDLVVDEQLVVELKSVESLLPIHEAQLMTYMKLANVSVGLLINFNVVHLRDGIRRRVLNYTPQAGAGAKTKT